MPSNAPAADMSSMQNRKENAGERRYKTAKYSRQRFMGLALNSVALPGIMFGMSLS